MNKRHLVDSLSLSRIIFGILFACSVFYLNGNLIIIFVIYFFAVLSDVLDGELFGTLVALMFYALPGIIVLFNFFKIPIIINLMLCIFITVCAIISSGLRIIHKRRN